jgi:hypothetical protein
MNTRWWTIGPMSESGWDDLGYCDGLDPHKMVLPRNDASLLCAVRGLVLKKHSSKPGFLDPAMSESKTTIATKDVSSAIWTLAIAMPIKYCMIVARIMFVLQRSRTLCATRLPPHHKQSSPLDPDRGRPDENHKQLSISSNSQSHTEHKKMC